MNQRFNTHRGGVKIHLISLTINVIGLLMACVEGWHYRGINADKLGLVAAK